MGDLKGLGDLDDESGVSLQEILINLLNGEDDLELKTEIFNPRDLTGLYMIGEQLKKEGFEEEGDIITAFIDLYLRYMVSHKRKSREEIIKAVSGLLDRETVKLTMSERLTKELK